ncbi:MAG: class 3 fructose-bisphosphatase [Fusobacteria bacterium]|nr:MAG: class 3 fructose-bisphosphatase [Fusobacteriota bacterium]
MEKEYYKLLSQKYKNVGEVTSEIINLEAILNLPKGTEHYLTDLHGEYHAFRHLVKTASGNLKIKIDELFGEILSIEEKHNFSKLIFYPEKILENLELSKKDKEHWYKISIKRILALFKLVSSKYTRSKVRKTLPSEYAYILEEFLTLNSKDFNKEEYYSQILSTIIELDIADDFIIKSVNLIQQLAVDKLHILGDIYDRGPEPHKIMDSLINHHNCDIQWGNHDILWIGASKGHLPCVANVLRISLRYSNLKVLEEGYGINLLPLGRFAIETYGDDPCTEFLPIANSMELFNDKEQYVRGQMHKAITIIQFKLEAKVISERPEFNMEKRMLLDKINFEKGTILLNEKEYKLTSNNFPTIDPKDPYKLTDREEEIIKKIGKYFKKSDKLKRHARFFFSNGSIYLKYNNQLMFHGCIPMDLDGNYKSFTIDGKNYNGKKLMDKFEELARKAYFKGDKRELDWLWYMWTGEYSPLFGKEDMKTFERYFIKEKETHKEIKNPYYKLRENEEIILKLMKHFDVTEDNGHIINGHTPVLTKKGELPMRAGNKLLVIDGGLSKAYQKTTGTAGYTLIYNSYGLRLASHEPFTTLEKAIEDSHEIISVIQLVDKAKRKKVKDTDTGIKLIKNLKELRVLLKLYREGHLISSK